MEIQAFTLEPCNLCQNRCEYCAHNGMRLDDPTYQMSLQEVEDFISH